MTEVINYFTNPIQNTDDLKTEYAGVGADPTNLKIGAEGEFWHVKTSSDPELGIEMTTADQIFAIKDQTEREMRDAKAERHGKPRELVGIRPLGKETTTGVLEMSSSAYSADEQPELYQDIQDFLDIHIRSARQHGASVCATSQIPTTTIEESWDKMLGDDRKKGILKNFADVLGEDALRFTFMTSTFQTSLSYADPAHMYDIISVANDLTPLLYVLGEDTTGFVENDERMLPYPPHMKYCYALGEYGGISSAYLSATDADSYLEHHIRTIAGMPMFSYFDAEGNVASSGEYHMPTWNGLREHGLNTGSNFRFVEGGTYWPDNKLCDIRDSMERPIGKRIEIRMVDRGYWLIGLSKMMQDREGNKQLRSLLEDYGFDGNPGNGSATLIRSAQFNALRRGHKFLDIPFGAAGKTSAPRTMADFAQDLSDVVGKYLEGTIHEPYMSGFHHICQTGRTNALVLQEMYPTLDAAKRFVAEAPDEIVRDMTKCMDQHREAGIMPKSEEDNVYAFTGTAGTGPELQG